MSDFKKTLKDSINFQVVLGLIAFRVVSTLIDKVLYPLINIYFLDEDIFRKLNIFINKDKKSLVLIEPVKDKEVKYEIHFGTLLKEIIVFAVVFILYYIVTKYIM